jgi:hypothetical protein
MCGVPLGIEPHLDPDERSINEKGVVFETLTYSINRRHGGYGRGDNTFSPRYPYVMSPLWDIITVQRFMMTRVARWML